MDHEEKAVRRQPVVARGHWLHGHAPMLIERPLSTLTELGRLGEVVRFRLSYLTAFLVRNPEHVRAVFQDPKTFNKRSLTYSRLRALAGDGLVTSEGELWRRQRRIAQPAFHKEKIAGFATAMSAAAITVAEQWRAPAARGETVDVAAAMTSLTLQIVCETLLGADVSGEREIVSSAFGELNHLMTERVVALVGAPLWIPTAANRRFLAARARLYGAVERIIAQRRLAATETPDLLSMLMHSRDEESGATMSDRQLRDEVVTMLFAGHETTAVALAWTFYLLAMHPGAEARLHEELDALEGRPPGLDDLARLPWTRMVVDEALRLYPPVYTAARNVAVDTVLDGYPIPRGAMVFASSWVVHRSPELWEAPDEFRPERFAPDRIAALPRYAYFPFIGGPRQCIGIGFALLEAQLIVATLAARYRLRLAPGQTVEPEPLLTLRPRGGLPMTVEPRRRGGTPSA